MPHQPTTTGLPGSITPFELAMLHAVARSAGAHGIERHGTALTVSEAVATALLVAASDIEGSLGDSGVWVDELVEVLAPALAEQLGCGWERAAEAIVICAAAEGADRFDQLALAALCGELTLDGPPATEELAARLGPDVAWLC